MYDDICTYGALILGVCSVLSLIVLRRGDRAMATLASMGFASASILCVVLTLGFAAIEGNLSLIIDTSPAFMGCSVALFVTVLVVNALRFRSARHAQ